MGLGIVVVVVDVVVDVVDVVVVVVVEVVVDVVVDDFLLQDNLAHTSTDVGDGLLSFIFIYIPFDLRYYFVDLRPILTELPKFNSRKK